MEQKFIPLSVPNLKGNEMDYVSEAVETEWVSTAGRYVNEFEERVADYVGVPGAVSCQNGTSGLHISLLVSGVTRNDEVIVPTLTFIAAVNPVSYIGAAPVFMDCDDSLCLDPIKLKKFCEEECDFQGERLINKRTAKCIKAIVVVHVFGNMADMPAILNIALKYNLKVIEDATEAIGTCYTSGLYSGCYAGTLGDIGVYSFNGNKIITAGGGGMIVSKDEDTLMHAKHLTTQAKSDELYYVHDEIGYNYRMTNLQAAIGLAQFEQLETFIDIKENNYKRYLSYIDDITGLKLLGVREGTRSNYWFYALYCEDKYKLNRDQLIVHLARNKVQSRPIWGLIHEQKPYKSAQTYCIEKAHEYLNYVVNIPCSTNLTTEDIETVMSYIK